MQRVWEMVVVGQCTTLTGPKFVPRDLVGAEDAKSTVGEWGQRYESRPDFDDDGGLLMEEGEGEKDR